MNYTDAQKDAVVMRAISSVNSGEEYYSAVRNKLNILLTENGGKFKFPGTFWVVHKNQGGSLSLGYFLKGFFIHYCLDINLVAAIIYQNKEL